MYDPNRLDAVRGEVHVGFTARENESVLIANDFRQSAVAQCWHRCTTFAPLLFERIIVAANNTIEIIMQTALLKIRRHAAVFGAIFILTIGLGTPALSASNGNQAFLIARQPASAPAGFDGVCAKYSWACAQVNSSVAAGDEMMALASSINKKVNRQTRQVTDLAQYRTQEFWALPTARGGDCEDFALLKKKLLLEAGVPSNVIMIATALDRQRKSHAVLVFRTGGGDYVLDNVNNSVKPWNKTGYMFLRMQNPRSPASWDAILAGG